MVPNSLSVQLLFNNWTEFGIENNNNMVLRCAFLPVDFDFSILQKILLFFHSNYLCTNTMLFVMCSSQVL